MSKKGEVKADLLGVSFLLFILQLALYVLTCGISAGKKTK